MLEIVQHSKFKADAKRLIRSGSFSKSDEKKLFDIIQTLAMGKPLAAKFRDHSLIGNWNKHRECHVKSDLLLKLKDTF